MKLPTLSYDLIAMLDIAYPDKCPDPKDSEREIWMKAGERRLVNTLLSKRDYQEKEGTRDSLLSGGAATSVEQTLGFLNLEDIYEMETTQGE